MSITTGASRIRPAVRLNQGVPGCSVQIGTLAAAARAIVGVAGVVEHEQLVRGDDEVDRPARGR